MATYVIGDVQGCYQELSQILDRINFNEQQDRLWFTGDLVNVGPQSLEVLNFVKNLGDIAITVLGNHDLHALATAQDPSRHKRPKDTLDTILASPDRKELLDWLRKLPFLHEDSALGFVLIHAGLVPQWDIHQAAELASEVEDVLRNGNYRKFIDHMYGNKPERWSEELTGWERLRFITNCFTRMRFCDAGGRVDLEEKGPPGSQHKPYQPWFTFTSRRTKGKKIIFGHWSTVQLGNIREFSKYNVYPLDTGCVWGGQLTALRLDDETLFSVPSQQPKFR
jgi:bis(5'-nucleosyl)-tetraphosphatase (symmetrical)